MSSCAYFPENKAVSGLFEVVKRIYGITAKERTDVDVASGSALLRAV